MGNKPQLEMRQKYGRDGSDCTFYKRKCKNCTTILTEVQKMHYSEMGGAIDESTKGIKN